MISHGRAAQQRSSPRLEKESLCIAPRVATSSSRISRSFRPFMVAAGLGCMLACAQPALSEEIKDYGKPGTPIDLVIGYQPYYTQAWSGVIMRSKKFYERSEERRVGNAGI